MLLLWVDNRPFVVELFCSAGLVTRGLRQPFILPGETATTAQGKPESH